MNRATSHSEGTTLKRSVRPSLPAIELVRGSRQPLHVQLAGQLRRAIASGSMPQRLPSTRALARHLRISRNTAIAAYEALQQDGVLDARTGSGTWRKAPATGLLKRTDLLRDSHYPFGAQPFLDPDGNPLYFHR